MRGPIRRRQKRDGNEREIIERFRAFGASVHQGGPLDLIVGFYGRTGVVEVKAPGGKLTEAEALFLKDHKGFAAVVGDVAGVADVLDRLLRD